MNIREAKEQIKRSVSIYLMKDEWGNYRIPLSKQRPIFLYGAPGIGKTAIMEQIAEELDISLVAYSMTHHTRQSALGLPFIVHKDYQGQSYDISRYTLSEIIASVYEKMESSGKQEGILFLDEINCVSETLGPSMLQFLQYKIFGNHQVPEGWVIVTAGNPPEFNRSVREFDVATMDRLKVMVVEPEYDAWRYYAVQRNIHKAILTFLDIKKDDFYDIQTTVDGKTYVTARGWEDLSEAIYLYEEKGYPVDETLISQYLRNNRIVGEFAAYYELFAKYRNDYHIADILAGNAPAEVGERAREAGFDEKITVTGLLLEAIIPWMNRNIWLQDDLRKRMAQLKEKKAAIAKGGTVDEKNAFLRRKQIFDDDVRLMKTEAAEISEKLSNIFRFVAEYFGEGNEMLILITELTVNYGSARFIAEKGCEEYFAYSKKFMMYDRNKELKKELQRIEELGEAARPVFEV
ncbi:MAG: AAA family ATPase [Eubacterium sp.]|nr:AAA family ATPase [Eubacterium sp.]